LLRRCSVSACCPEWCYHEAGDGDARIVGVALWLSMYVHPPLLAESLLLIRKEEPDPIVSPGGGGNAFGEYDPSNVGHDGY
jgi:hypothetical protein